MLQNAHSHTQGKKNWKGGGGGGGGGVVSQALSSDGEAKIKQDNNVHDNL